MHLAKLLASVVAMVSITSASPIVSRNSSADIISPVRRRQVIPVSLDSSDKWIVDDGGLSCRTSHHPHNKRFDLFVVDLGPVRDDMRWSNAFMLFKMRLLELCPEKKLTNWDPYSDFEENTRGTPQMCDGPCPIPGRLKPLVISGEMALPPARCLENTVAALGGNIKCVGPPPQ
ncbi:Hypothetical protein D9617_1g082940 [Elsinoe fawcettii]|nr:Hypothetical protein D9617_1g082940 [Elsinoe fawcettii]